MASAIIHYVIANSLLNRIDVNNKNHFVIGSSLGPDASSHEDGSYDIAHFLSFSQEGTRKGIHWKHFAERYQEQILTNDFVLGYYCHLIQDAVWFHDIVDTNIRCYVGDEKKQAYRRGYRDYERLN